MQFWIFKIADQELYPDEPGVSYIYDNTHTVRVAPGDEFLYLDKTKRYSSTGSGRVAEISTTSPEHPRTPKVKTVFRAQLEDVVYFKSPLTIDPSIVAGRFYRGQLGIVDANLLGWSQSMPRIEESMFDKILSLAELPPRPQTPWPKPDYKIEDRWAKVKVRCALNSLRQEVFERDRCSCLVCGASQNEILELAHLSPYANDKYNRANPANALCLCVLCHRALDRRLIGLGPDGRLHISPRVIDPFVRARFESITAAQRRPLLACLEPRFLALTVAWLMAAERAPKP